jgi:hypothetical protein
MCGDINVNYLNEDNRKNQLVMHSYNLNSVVTFPTRVGLSTSTLIDNCFIDINRNGEYDIYQHMNGLSDHDAQMLTLCTVQKLGQQHYTYTPKRMINKAIRAMLGYGNTVSCRNIFKELGILPLASQYLFSLLLFVSYNKALSSSNIDSHTIATRQSQDVYLPQANLTVYQKGVYYAGIKMYNKISTEIKSAFSNLKGSKLY